MDSKKVIEKLIKIAENQQKIIAKLAQQAGIAPAQPEAAVQPSGWQDVTQAVAQVLATVPGGKAARVQSAQLGASGLHIKLQVRDLTSNVDSALRDALAGTQLRTSDGRPVQAPGVPQINVITQTG